MSKKLSISGSFGLVACVALLVSLFAGLSSAQATTERKKPKKAIVILSKSPQTPVAGQPFTIEFAVYDRDVQIPLKGLGCFGRTDKIFLLKLIEEEHDGWVARCTWEIPTKAKGQTMYGILAAILAKDERTFRGIEFPIQ